MTAYRITQTGRNSWAGTRPPMNCADRYRIFGPLLPMDEDKQSVWQRIFGRK